MAAKGTDTVDLLVIGGGINGCGIARDAAGRGLSVVLAEMGDLGGATSSASTKLFHGGLRYLEYFEFRLVREALRERDVLLRNMPHIAWPMRFVLPFHPDQRFEGDTPTSQLLARVMPWTKGRRPAWLIRAGLALYDGMARSRFLPGARSVDLRTDPAGRPLKDRYQKAFEYSDVWVEDSRLVALNARDAAERGAEVMTRTKVTGARREDGVWAVELEDRETGRRFARRARLLVNAGGPWVRDVVTGTLRIDAVDKVRLVRGSHIVTKRLFDHDKCYFFQGRDGRIIFAIPYETDYTLIGTTDAEHEDPSEKPVCTPEERDYLLAFASEYFARPVTVDDVVWTYSGVRPLFDDGASSATAATRDYVLKLERGEAGDAPLLNVFGGKITTYRRLAEGALRRIGEAMAVGEPWTADAPLPGGDFAVDGAEALMADLLRSHPFLTGPWAQRLVKAYGTEAREILGGAVRPDDLGRDFGATLREAEVRWLMEREFARTAEDVVWRRSKLGLRMKPAEIAALDEWMRGALADRAA